jgi:glycerol kinase
VLALDQGGHASRAIVFDATGRNVASGSCDVAETRPADDRVEQDPEELVRSLRRAAKDAFKHLGKRETDVVAAGLATQRSSIVAWDKTTGAALTPVISWQDRRARDRIGELAEHAGMVRAKTGLRLSPHYGASKLAWVLANVPAASAALREGRLAFGPLSSFLAFRLLDEKPLIADPANASRTLLWNVATRCFDPKLCDLFGVPIGALPACVPTRARHGTLDVRGRKVPMNVITGDQSAAIFAAGEPDPACAYVNFGTGAFVQRTFTDAELDAPRLLKSVVFADQERTTLALEGTVNGAGSALSLAIEELGLQDESPDLDAWLEREKDPPLYLNGVSGLGAPYWVADFEARFVGEGTREARLVAVLESIVFLVDIVLVEMGMVLPMPARIRVSGGLSRLDGLCRRLADVSGIRVERADDPEATARGLAWLVHGNATFVERAVTTFEPRSDPGLRERFVRYCAEIERALT